MCSEETAGAFTAFDMVLVGFRFKALVRLLFLNRVNPTLRLDFCIYRMDADEVIEVPSLPHEQAVIKDGIIEVPGYQHEQTVAEIEGQIRDAIGHQTALISSRGASLFALNVSNIKIEQRLLISLFFGRIHIN